LKSKSRQLGTHAEYFETNW